MELFYSAAGIIFEVVELEALSRRESLRVEIVSNLMRYAACLAEGDYKKAVVDLLTSLHNMNTDVDQTSIGCMHALRFFGQSYRLMCCIGRLFADRKATQDSNEASLRVLAEHGTQTDGPQTDLHPPEVNPGGEREVDTQPESQVREPADRAPAVADATASLAEKDRQLRNFSALLMEQEHQLTELRSTLADHQLQLADSNAKLANSQREQAALTARLAACQRQLADSSIKLADSHQEFADAKNALAHLEQQLSDSMELLQAKMALIRRDLRASGVFPRKRVEPNKRGSLDPDPDGAAPPSTPTEDSFMMAYSHEPGYPTADIKADPSERPATGKDFVVLDAPGQECESSCSEPCADTRMGPTPLTVSRNPPTGNCVVLTFNKNPKHLADALRASQVGQRLLAQDHDLEPTWAHGANILVEGLTPELLEEAGHPPDMLRSCQVVVLESEEQEALALLTVVRYKDRPRLKARTHLTSDQQASETSKVGEKGQVEEKGSSPATSSSDDFAIVDKTFITIKLPKDISPRSTFTKSSNDRYGIPNPRQWPLPSSSV